MDGKKIKDIKIPIILMFFLIGWFFGCQNKTTEDIHHLQNEDLETEVNYSNETTQEIALEKPPLTDGIFPCMDCHSEMDTNPERRDLVDMHDDITEIFHHDSENRWCLDCHDVGNRDYLRLASGELLDFKESYKLCGQCHGDKLRDWKVGIHGKRKGYWNADKEYLLCVHCHDPHSPKFKSMTPEPPPMLQKDIK